MQTAFVKKRALSPILIAAAILALALVLFFLLRSSADPAPAAVEDFGFQTVAGDSLESDETSLRFLFTVDSLEYSRVGFVFSKTNRNPTVGGSGCQVWEPANGKVYRSVRADGETIPAPNGRWWVAVKVTGIPKSYFESPIYVRPFVEGVGIEYGTARNLSVEAAFLVPGLRDDVAGFGGSDFGTGSIRTDLGGSYALPPVNPTADQHPRVLFTSGSIDGLNAALTNAPTAASTGFAAALASPPDGILSSGEFDQDTLNAIQMLALDYQMTGNLLSGYRAVYAIKNVLKTMGNWKSMGDYTRYYGFVMYNAACVYDWCYDLLTENDRQQIVLGVQKKVCEVGMEVGFPPSGQRAVTGHGTEFQILRDYLAFAIAVYDEYPGWWNYIGGRFYEEFVPVRNTFYQAGMYPEGVSNYVRLRYSADLYSAWLVKAATGTFPYASAANMKQVARTIYSYDLPRTNGFAEGDDQVPFRDFIDYGRVALMSSYLFDDRTMRAQLQYDYNSEYGSEKYGAGYYNFSGELDVAASIAEYLICSSSGLTKTNSRYDGMDLILYNGGWLGQIIARNKWTSSQAAVLMKIGVRTTANHAHYDSGSFQIFYKSPLALDTGVYYDYGESHHKYYHQATIAHNSLLIYNPSLKYNDDGYYSGGQARRTEPTNYSNWQSSTYKTGEVTGVAYGYNGSTPTYAYLAGDIAAAYDSSVVSEVTRRMLAVYDTDNAEVPMYFFVFDNVTAKNSSYKKTFLLHVPNEPTVAGKTVTVENYAGKLVLQNVIGGDSVEKVGGDNKNYWVNSNGADSYVQLAPGNSRNDGSWGRVEISPNTGSATNQMLNVMYVCDASSDPGLTATGFSNGTVQGAVIGNTAAVFVTNKTRRNSEFSFTVSGDGTLKYYVSGVAAGDWQILSGGSPVAYATATEDGGFLTFSAPAGATITLRPGTPNITVEPILPDDGWNSFDFSNLN
ncbi:MAG: heparinase II/III family protein [Clostridia bacterium]|nr:heparinase II/III family protein [Clostridia bacterium]